MIATQATLQDIIQKFEIFIIDFYLFGSFVKKLKRYNRLHSV